MSFLVEAASAAYGETCHYRRPTGGDRALKSLKPSMGLLGHHLLGKQRILLDCLLSPAPASTNILNSLPKRLCSPVRFRAHLEIVPNRHLEILCRFRFLPSPGVSMLC